MGEAAVAASPVSEPVTLAEGAPTPEGVWLVGLTPDAAGPLTAQQALFAFHADGTVAADFAAVATGDQAPVLSAGQGEWSFDGEVLDFVLVALAVDADGLFVGTVAFNAHARLGGDPPTLDGEFDYSLSSPPGQPAGSGAGTLRGSPIGL
jgi:hypothetical protein